MSNPQQAVVARPIQLGVSGGNIHSILTFQTNGKPKGCFSGTLGSLVQDSDENQFILSNNHVLADQNKAKPGQRILQPGLVDVACLGSKSNTVATFSKTINLNFAGGINTVDAAIAAVVPGQVSPQILFIGDIAGTVATPTLALPVQKMGRTTCLTEGVIASLDANVVVNYAVREKHKLASFINQILVTGNTITPTFGGPGDSGSLIVTDDDCPQAVALLFAGTTGTTSVTIANPISTVLSKLNVSMVGSCDASIESEPEASDVAAGSVSASKAAVATLAAVRDRHESQLMSIQGAVGTGIGVSDGSDPTIEVYVKKLTAEAQAAAPKDLEGMPVKLVETGEFVAY